MIYVVNSCAIDTETFEVHRDGSRVPVEPQVFDLLCLLIENRDRIVTREEIIEKVWKGRIVSEAAISSRIKAARRAIGDDGKVQGIIRTVHRRGIRFVGELTLRNTVVTTHAPAAASSVASFEPPPAPERVALSSDDADGTIGIDMSLPKRPSLVVLPFELLGGEPEHKIIADGLSLDLMTGLARTRWLFVIARGTAFMFRGHAQNAPSVADKLGVRYVLQGNMHVHGRRVRIHAALIDAAGSREVWADHFDRAIDDIFSVQDEISSVIIGAVESEIELAERQRALIVPPSSLDAWSAYHRATWHMFRFTPEAYEEAERLFKLSAKLDPSSPRAFAGLSFVHWQRAFLEIGNDRQGEIDQATEFARQALILDPRDPQGHWALGRSFQLRQEFGLAIEEMENALALNPNFALGHYSVAFARALDAQNDKSEISVRLARRLSPYDLMRFAMLATQGLNASLLGRVEEGADLADRAARQANAHYHVVAIAAFCNARAGRMEVAQGLIGSLARSQGSYRISDYLRAFPYRDPGVREMVRKTFRGLGLVD
ncbi:MAG: winged helix-turn-helix domain-containing tetratricopeptide repeat protein [Hyphomicrobiaceae bacterium]